MMKSEIFQEMKETGNLHLSNWQRFWHFSIVLFLLIVPAITTINLVADYFTGSYSLKSYPSELFIYGYVWLIPATIFYYIQKRRLRFRTILISVDVKTFHQSAKITAKDLDWQILKMTDNVIVAKRGFSWRSWGELITIIRDHDRILFNSICDPENRPSVASWGMNKVNRITFENHLQ
jgi:hypothetical protein